MKTKIKVLISSLLAILFMFTGTTAFAQTQSPGNDDIQVLEENMGLLEAELSNANTTVLAEINKQKAEYQQMLQNTTSAEQRDKIQALVDTTNDMIAQYQQYQSGISGYGVYNPVYSAAVVSVVAFFNVNGYKLASELLTKALNNSDLDSEYVPEYGYLVTQSALFRQIVNSSATNGSGEFLNAGSKTDKDLFYGIHNFNYFKFDCNRQLAISDRYDYDKEDYSGLPSIGGVAIHTMYLAQTAGVIIPFYTAITAPC